MSKELRLLAIIILLAGILRVAAIGAFGPGDYRGGDYPLFDRMARNLLTEGDFGGEPAATYGSPHINPAFAFWLAVLYFIFGASPTAVLVGQVVLGVLIIWGTFLLASRALTRRAGLTAAAFCAVWPPLIIMTIEYGSVLLYSALFLFSIVFLWLALEEGRAYYSFLGGIFLGLATLTESIAFYLFLIWGLWMLGLAIFKRLPWRRAAFLWLVFVVAAAAALSPWILRNSVVDPDHINPVSKGEWRLISPRSLETISDNLRHRSILLTGLNRLFLLPYGLWLFDNNSGIVYKSIPLKLWSGEKHSLSVLFLFWFKAIIGFIYWGVILAAIYAVFRFKIFGTMTVLLVIYTTVAVISYVAWRGGNFDQVSYPSVFVAPLLPLLATLMGGLCTDGRSQTL